MKIYIDGDACPVKNETIQLAEKFQLPVVIVTSLPHYSEKVQAPHVTTLYVDSGADSADFRLMSMLHAGDLVITQDYGLASLALGKNCRILHQKGWEYTIYNIDELLESRYQSAKLRKAGKHTRGPKAFTNEDRQTFSTKLMQVLEEMMK